MPMLNGEARFHAYPFPNADRGAQTLTLDDERVRGIGRRNGR